MTGPEENSEFCFPRFSMFPRVICCIAKKKKTKATAVNISQVTVNCFPFDIIVSQCCPLKTVGGTQFDC